ncbi:MAG: hypothetical protein K2W95_09630 [Candidatus Obscuribacterales bacterium]|nr:hypothetical protein [Candidatus Obscuribacterales bacterium]
MTCFLSSEVIAQTSPELHDVQNQFIPEAGCPVRIVKAETRMEIDSFGAPMACRIYIDYTNVSDRPLQGVKFRLGYIDRDGKVRGTFHAPDGRPLSPGSQNSHKWRGDKVDPRTTLVKIRVLTARYADGTFWESEKMKDIAKPPGADSASSGGDGGTAGPEFEGGGAAPPAAPPKGSEGL